MNSAQVILIATDPFSRHSPAPTKNERNFPMRRLTPFRKFITTALLLLIAAAVFFIWYYLRTWPLRFHGELDAFFGKGNWKQISSETRESLMYSVYHRSTNPSLSGERPGKFHEWDIAFTNRSGETEIWTISDHTMRINQDKYWLLSPKRYSARQALTQELMDLSFGMAGQQVLDEILRDILPEQEADCINVEISYRNGNPPPGMYSRLSRQSWFNVEQISASEYLKTDLYDFYIRILAYDYRVEKLTQEEQEHLFPISFCCKKEYKYSCRSALKVLF